MIAHFKLKMIIIIILFYSFYLSANEPTDRQMEGYHELLVLWKIDPSWPGLEELIIKAEEILGLRPPVISPEDQLKSDEEYNNALKIIQTLTEIDVEKLQEALKSVDKSLTLNPNNEKASILRDEIVEKIPTDEKIILPSHLRKQYNKALEEYQKGNIFISFQIIREYETNETMIQFSDFRMLRKLVYDEVDFSDE